MRIRLVILAGLLLCLLGSPASADSASPAKVKEAAQRAVPYLLKQRDKTIQEGIEGKGCMSCHWGGSAVLSLALAERRGLVERKEVQKFGTLLERQSTRKTAYFLNDKTLNALKSAGLADDKQAALKKKINQRYDTPKQMRDDLAKSVPAEVLGKNEEALLKLAINPNFFDTIGKMMSATILLTGAASTTAKPETVTSGLVESLLLLQQADGSFFEQGQPFFPCDGSEQAECQTLWVVQALHRVEQKSPAVVQALERAQAYLHKKKPGKSTVTLMLRALWAQDLNDKAGVAEFSTAFLKEQKKDGGWSSWNWSKGDYSSDAWATGFGLYTLHRLGHPPTDAAVQQGQAFLLKSQEDDGGWTTSNSKNKGTRIWTYWSTSWAVVGLLETLPE